MSKILIVTERTAKESSMIKLLHNIGYEIIFSSTEEEAFESTNKYLPDIALIDTSCAEINVSNVCKKLKLHSQTNDIQIILLTSKDSPSEDIMVGADGYITKPFSDNILIATVNAHLRIKKLWFIFFSCYMSLSRINI